jgi:hypothetical protein
MQCSNISLKLITGERFGNASYAMHADLNLGVVLPLLYLIQLVR